MTTTAVTPAATEPDEVGSRLAHRATILGAVFAAWGLVFLVANRSIALVTRSEPFDLDINVVAARRLVAGRDLYDAAASQAEGVRHVSSILRFAYHDTFSGYVGGPVVALLHVPFTWASHGTGVATFRVLNLGLIVGAVVLVIATLPRVDRLPGTLVGAGALMCSYPLVTTLELGQFHGLVMAGIALGMWGVANNRFTVAGIGLGLATLLKLSPVLLIVYLVLRGRRQVVRPAVLTAIGLSIVGLVVGRPAALFDWVANVVPKLSGGTRFVRNQSLPAVIERVTTGSNDIASQLPLGDVRYVGPLLAVMGCLVLWGLCRRRNAFLPLELGAMTLVLLVAGPLTWDHYYVWTVLPVVALCDTRLWQPLSSTLRRVTVAVGGIALLVLSLPVRELQASTIARDWGLRATGSPYPFAALLLLGVSGVLLGSRETAKSASADGVRAERR